MKTVLLISLALLPNLSLATSSPIRVGVKGLVCSFCARGLTQVLSRQKTLEKFDIQVSEGSFQIWLKENQYPLKDSDIREWVKQSGLEVARITRD